MGNLGFENGHVGLGNAVLVWGMGKWRFENGGAGWFILLSGLVLRVLRLFFRFL